MSACIWLWVVTHDRVAATAQHTAHNTQHNTTQHTPQHNNIAQHNNTHMFGGSLTTEWPSEARCIARPLRWQLPVASMQVGHCTEPAGGPVLLDPAFETTARGNQGVMSDRPCI